MRLSLFENGWGRWCLQIGRLILVVGRRTSTWIPLRIEWVK
jgi:hypothetical protein